MELLHNFVAGHALTFSAAILIVAYIFIATEKIPKVTVALIGAALTLILGLVEQSRGHESIDPHYFINFVDFGVIFLLISMMIIVHITAKSGVFNWVANEILKQTKGHPIKLLIALAIFTAIASAFLDNVTTVILIMPITFVIAKELDINPVPFLITEILASNIGGTATLIGDPPNIIIGSKAGFSFMDFVNELTIIVAIILIASIGILILLFRKQLKSTPEKMAAVAKLDNSKTITDKVSMIRSLIVLGLVILGFILHDALHLESYLIAMTGASILLLFEKPNKIFCDVEWNTIFFFIGLFIIIGGLEASGGIKAMAEWLLNVTNGSQTATAMIMLWGSLRKDGYTRSYTSLVRVVNKWIKPEIKQKQARKTKPYQRAEYPGQKVQVDVKFVPSYCVVNGQKYYQYTAVDECTRWTFREMYDEHSTYSSTDFLKKLILNCPFPIREIQTDNGTEFTRALISDDGKPSLFEEMLEFCGIKYHRIRVATPRYNGKVERQHRTDEKRYYKKMKMYNLADGRQQLAKYNKKSNNIPKICLGFLAPNEMLQKYLGVM